MAGLFDGVRVVEIGHPLTEYAGALWARLGAEVYLVEPPAGVETRRRLPRVPGAGESSRGSMAFLARNAGKRSVVFDANSARDREALLTLCDSADVLLDADGSAFHEIVAESRASVAATVTDAQGLGTSSIVGFAASGGMASSGWPHQPPCNAPSWLAHDGAGTYAAVMAAVGLLAVRGGADSARYEIPYEEAATAAITPWTRILHSHETHAVGQGTQAARLGPNGFPIYETKDGYVRCLAGTPKQWRAFVELLGSPEELTFRAVRRPQVPGRECRCAQAPHRGTHARQDHGGSVPRRAEAGPHHLASALAATVPARPPHPRPRHPASDDRSRFRRTADGAHAIPSHTPSPECRTDAGTRPRRTWRGGTPARGTGSWHSEQGRRCRSRPCFEGRALELPHAEDSSASRRTRSGARRRCRGSRSRVAARALGRRGHQARIARSRGLPAPQFRGRQRQSNVQSTQPRREEPGDGHDPSRSCGDCAEARRRVRRHHGEHARPDCAPMGARLHRREGHPPGHHLPRQPGPRHRPPTTASKPMGRTCRPSPASPTNGRIRTTPSPWARP